MRTPQLTDPSNPALPAPIFGDTDAARGDHLRANNSYIWQNFAALDGLTSVLAIGAANLQMVLLANIGQQRFYASTSTTNTPSSSFAWLIDVKWQDWATSSCLVTATAEGSLLEYQIECNAGSWGAWVQITDANGTPFVSLSGWVPTNQAFTFASLAGAPTFTMTVPGDQRRKYSRGMRVQLQQSLPLTSYWAMNNATPANDGTDSLGLNNGTCTNVADTTTGLPFGSHAATFNGSTSKIVFTSSASLKPTGDFTISGWFKSISFPGTAQGLFQSYAANTNQGGILIQITSAGVLSVTVGTNTAATATVLTGLTVVTSGWIYMTYTQKANWGQLYINGKLEVCGYVPTPVYNATSYQRFGCINTTSSDGSFFSGLMLDWFIVTGSSGTTATGGYALDELTALQLYNNSAAIGATSLSAVTKTFIVSANTTYDGSANSTLTLYGGTDFSLQNTAIANVYYSTEKAPFGFSLNPDKWSVQLWSSVSALQNSPVIQSWYNIGSLSVSIPIGVWDVSFKCDASAIVTPASVQSPSVYATLSKTSLSQTEQDFIAFSSYQTGVSDTKNLESSLSARKIMLCNAATTLNLLLTTLTTTSKLYVNPEVLNVTIIKAVSTLI